MNSSEPTTSTAKVVIVCVDENEAIYKDGVLQLEGYVLGPQSVLAAAGVASDIAEADYDWFQEQGRSFPLELGDVVWRKKR